MDLFSFAVGWTCSALVCLLIFLWYLRVMKKTRINHRDRVIMDFVDRLNAGTVHVPDPPARDACAGEEE